MSRKRNIIAISVDTGEKIAYESTYGFAQEIGVSHQAVMQALSRNGICKGLRLYDTPDNIRKRIAELNRQLKELEG